MEKLIGDLEHWREAFDKLNDALEDIDAVVCQSETSLAEILQSTAITDSQRLPQLHVRPSH